MKNPGIGLCGIGIVGSGVFNLLKENGEHIARRLGVTPRIVHVAYLANPFKCDLSQVKQSSDVFEAVNNPDVGLVVELIGGKTLARDVVLEAIRQGKHVVTANKALLAEHGEEIFHLARERQVQVRYEAAIAGTIPIVKALREGLVGNRIQALAGIINGTSNFILSEMERNQKGFGDVLVEAQRLGYA